MSVETGNIMEGVKSSPEKTVAEQHSYQATEQGKDQSKQQELTDITVSQQTEATESECLSAVQSDVREKQIIPAGDSLNNKSRKKKRKKSKNADESITASEGYQLGDISGVIQEHVDTAVAAALQDANYSAFQQIEALKQDIIELKNAVSYRDKEMSALQTLNTKLLEKVKICEGRLYAVEQDVEENKEAMIQNKCREMQDNIMFFNIPEQDKVPEECITLIFGFLQAEMGIPENELYKITFDWANRKGVKTPGRCRPIIAKCNPPSGKKIIMDPAKKLRG